MTLKASNTITLKNILFGDIWLCSGQSNLELPMERIKDKYKEIISKASNSEIRQFLVPDEYYFEKERNDFSSGSWIEASPQNVLQFTGVGYFFALEIYEKYKIPIGLINSALGGSPAESWISEENIKKFPDYNQEYLKFKDGKLEKQIDENDRKISSEWYKLVNNTDIGLKNKCRKIDRPITALLQDLKQRGLLDETLVVWGSEFGRTPMQENREGKTMPFKGRDHHGEAAEHGTAHEVGREDGGVPTRYN